MLVRLDFIRNLLSVLPVERVNHEAAVPERDLVLIVGILKHCIEHSCVVGPRPTLEQLVALLDLAF